MRKLEQRRRRRQGQGLTEYVIIVGLIAILLVFSVNKFRAALQGAFERGADAIKEQVTDKLPEAGKQVPSPPTGG